MNIVVTGAGGQLATELGHPDGVHSVVSLRHDQLDITDAQAVAQCIASLKPDVVVNAAAYTAVDKAESDRDLAFAVNRDGPANLARACEAQGIALVHVSTDYVFDGSKPTAYVESDVVSPLGVYGESKLAGEQAVAANCSRYVILRTSWVVSAHGNNFVKTMLRLAAEREQLGIVSDQYGCPTAAAELARAIYAIIDGGLRDEQYGVYHFCQPEPTSWHGFATAIFDEAGKQGYTLALKEARAIATSDYPTPAARPANSVMDCTRFEQTFGFTIKPWRESLQELISELRLVSD